MPTHAAFLRAVNLGGHRRVASADLRATFEEIGFASIATFRAWLSCNRAGLSLIVETMNGARVREEMVVARADGRATMAAAGGCEKYDGRVVVFLAAPAIGSAQTAAPARVTHRELNAPRAGDWSKSARQRSPPIDGRLEFAQSGRMLRELDVLLRL
jgi:hypothetical protein